MKDAFFVARLHSKEYADFCASMRDSDLVTDTAQKEVGRQKMMSDAGISENASSSSGNGNGSKVLSPDGTQSVKVEVGVKVEAPVLGALESTSDTSLMDIKSEDAAVVSHGLKVEVKGEDDKEGDSDNMDSEVKEDDQGPPLTPSSGALTPIGSRSSRRVKGRAKSDTPVADLEEKEGEVDSQNEIDRDTNNSSSDLGVSETKTADDDGSNSEVIVKDEMVEVVVKVEEAISVKTGDEIVKSVSTVDFSSVKSEIEITSSSSKKLLAVPGTTKTEIIKGVYLKDDTEDVDDTLESEHFDTRQSFLNLCQGNHYQFDQLRRAKHTSMMVLYHLHNPDAPKFVSNCNQCHKDILIGFKYRCEPCEQDFCPECYKNMGNRLHMHVLKHMPVSAVVAPPTLTDEQRRQRQQAIDLHLTLLVHASSCVLGNDCKSRHCQKMKVNGNSIRSLPSFLRVRLSLIKTCHYCHFLGNFESLKDMRGNHKTRMPYLQKNSEFN